MKVNKEIIEDTLPDIVEDLYSQLNELIQRVDYLSMDISRLAARIDAQSYVKDYGEKKAMFSEEGKRHVR
jgi:hypothetical protein